MSNNFLKSHVITLTHSPDLSHIKCVWKMMNEIVYTKNDFQNVAELWKNIQNAAVIVNAEKRSTIKKMLHNLLEMYLNVITKNVKV